MDVYQFKQFSILCFVFILFPPCFTVNNVISVIQGNVNSTTSSCKEMLDSFAYYSSNFTYCAIRHARPIKLCQECISTYLEVKNVYTAILQIEDMGGDLCRDQLINLDRLQVVDGAFNYVDQLWGRASCNSCFSYENGKPSLTPEVSLILNKSSIYEACVGSYHNASSGFPDNITCSNCQNAYLELNDIYNNMRAASGDINYCMDMIDLMNTTRFMWSSTLGCCNDRKKPESTFISIMCGVLAAPCIFYILVYAFTRKPEHLLLPQKRWKEKFNKRSSIASAVSS